MARILLIEDNHQMRSMIRQMLERAGYEVIEAPNGNLGISLYRENPADLIITDLIMPDKEGIETIIELKRDYPAVKIMAISGGGQINPEVYLSMAKKAGAQCILAKPFAHEDLLKGVQELLG